MYFGPSNIFFIKLDVLPFEYMLEYCGHLRV